MELFAFLSNIPFLEEALTILLAFHATAIIIVNMTDTPVDNKIVAIAYRYIEFFAGVVKASKVKQPNPVDEKK